MVKCVVCQNKTEAKYKHVKDGYLLISYVCPHCGRIRQTKRSGKAYRYASDPEFREKEKKRYREFYRKYGR
jgi:hypothetical protein